MASTLVVEGDWRHLGESKTAMASYQEQREAKLKRPC